MIKLYPCARYHEHMAGLRAEQKADAPDEAPLERDSSFCAFSCGQTPTAVEISDGESQFWECPCAVALSTRDAKTHKQVLFETSRTNPAHIVRVRALLELVDLTWPPEKAL